MPTFAQFAEEVEGIIGSAAPITFDTMIGHIDFIETGKVFNVIDKNGGICEPAVLATAATWGGVFALAFPSRTLH